MGRADVDRRSGRDASLGSKSFLRLTTRREREASESKPADQLPTFPFQLRKFTTDIQSTELKFARG